MCLVEAYGDVVLYDGGSPSVGGDNCVGIVVGVLA